MNPGDKMMTQRRLLMLLLLAMCLMTASLANHAQAQVHRGYLSQVNRFFTIDANANIQLGNNFPDTANAVYFDPTGNLAIAQTSDYSTTRSLKWYRFEDDGSLTASPNRLPTALVADPKYHSDSPVYWTATPYRVLVGSLPYRVWDLDLITLNATLVSEYFDPDAGSDFAAIIPESNILYTVDWDGFLINRLNYNSASGQISGPTQYYPSPYRGQSSFIQSPDYRMLFQFTFFSDLTIYKIRDDGSLKITFNVDLGDLVDTYNIRDIALNPVNNHFYCVGEGDVQVADFLVTEYGTLTPMTPITNISRGEDVAVSPDGKFIIVVEAVGNNSRSNLRVYLHGSEGELTYYPGKDVFFPNNRNIDVTFIPQRQPIITEQ